MELVQLTTQLKLVTDTNKLADYVAYPKQREFHAAGLHWRERLLMAGNQLGKTLAAAMEVAMHMTGLYPSWWDGYRFGRATRGIAGSESIALTMKGVQRLLLGNPETPENWGTGSIPRDCLADTVRHPGVPNAVSAIVVKHISGDNSVCTLSSYDQGRTKWQADTLDWGWFDEEPPEDVYMEGITRTNVTQGPIFITFTPLKGMTNVVRRYYPTTTAFPGTHVTHMTIDDALHYTPEQRQAILDSYPEHEKKARARGLPALGSGRVFEEVDEDDIKVKPFSVPDYWAFIGGLDFGWDHPCAGVKLAWDRDSDIIYVTHAYRKKNATPVLFAPAVLPWGRRPDGSQWMPWAWPHDGLQHDKGSGEQLAKQYEEAGLKMHPQRATFEDGTNGLEAGVTMMLDRMRTGRWKVFAHLVEYFEEFNNYHRKDGLIVKLADDLLSASRYGAMMRRFAVPFAKPGTKKPPVMTGQHQTHGQGWMG